MSSFWETDAPPDWSIEFKPGEYGRLAQWYANGHGFGDLRFDPFVPFMHKLRPDALKRYRLYNDSVGRGYALEEPTRAIIPLALHYYVAERYSLGIAQPPREWERWWQHVARRAIVASYLVHHGRPGPPNGDQTRLVHAPCQRRLSARQRREPEPQLQT
jgi:hypothetical protein